jgi:hypothetical protein
MNRGTTTMSTTAAPESLQTMLLSDTPMIQQVEFWHHVSFSVYAASTAVIYGLGFGITTPPKSLPIDGTAQPTRIVASALALLCCTTRCYPGTTGLTA